MSTSTDSPQGTRDRGRGLAAMAVFAVVIVLGATAAITTRPDSSPAVGAMSWVERERPSGPVLTISGWGLPETGNGRFLVITAPETELVDFASGTDAGSIVVPSDSRAVAELEADGSWTMSYSDEAATVFVHEGALPVPGAT